MEIIGFIVGSIIGNIIGLLGMKLIFDVINRNKN